MGSFDTNHSNDFFRKLYRESKPLKRWIQNHGGTREDADDAIQEAVILVVRYAAKYPQNSHSYGGLLYRIGQKYWLQELRKRGKQTDLTLLPDEADADIGTLLEQEARYRKLSTILQRLGDTCKSLLQLYYFNKMPMAEIARVLKLSGPDVAKATKYKCLDKARTMMKG